MRIALVHGAWADGSSWAAVIRRLQAAGHEVVAPQLPHTSLADNVAKVRHALSLKAEPTLVAAHSYGGQVITALGSDAPNVVGLVYVAGFGLDEGESIGGLLGQGPPTPAIAKFQVDEQGFAWLPEDAFLQHFAPDVDPVEARVMCAVQQPLSVSTLDDVMTTPAWKSFPTWFAVAQHDEVIPPDAERLFAQRMGATTVEVDSSHVAMISHPDEVTDLIQSAVDAV
jgi:pimeloyl-ACP methyl ester carboxylesterase